MKVVSHHKENSGTDKLIKELKILLADNFTLYVKALNYHWNVKGPMFLSLHDFFESQYTDLAEANDKIAERIRQLDSDTPASLEDFKNMTHVEETTAAIDANQMIKSLIQGHEVLVNTCKKCLKTSTSDEVSTDLIIQRMAFHEKSIWMLHSMTAKS